MTDKNQSRPLPSHFVRYDYRQPSPLFTRKQVDYIESIRNDFSKSDLAKIRSIEWFELNLNVNMMAEGSIPGLREDSGMGFRYIKRFNKEKYKKMMNIFLSYIPKNYPSEDKGKCYMPSYRVTVPDGGQLYPIVFHGDLDAWHRRLNESAEVHHTLLGGFDRGTFVLSDGQRFEFSSIVVDSLETESYPKDW